MKFLLSTLFAIVLCSGCATRQQVANMEGRGHKEIYNATYEQTWRAAIDAAQVSNLRIRTADREQGFIATGRGLQPHTFGENVGIWVRPVSPTQTQVEVTSQQAGPPALWLKNWERDIFSAVRANLTREAQSTIMEPAGADLPGRIYTEPAPRTYVPEQAYPPVAPPRLR